MTTQEIARESRLKTLDMLYKAQTSHIGSLFSCADIMAVLMPKVDFDKDRFVLSAGWKAAMLYFHLWKKGKITEEELDSYCQEGSEFIGLAEPLTRNGENIISIAGGSMGLGLPGAVGIAMAKKLKGEEGMVYCLMSDGEVAIGTTWESALIAVHHKLDNLVVIVDRNGWQAMGATKDVLDLGSLIAKFADFGWLVMSVDGHNHEELSGAFEWSYEGPVVILAETIKGKGVSFMEDNNLYHYKALSGEEYTNALQELT